MTSRTILAVHAAAVVVMSLLLTIVWASTTRAFFWPAEAIAPLAATVAVHGWVVMVAERPDLRGRFLDSRALALHTGIAGSLWLYLFALWAIGGGYFWPAWPLLGLAALVGAHAIRVTGRKTQGKQS